MLRVNIINPILALVLMLLVFPVCAQDIKAEVFEGTLAKKSIVVMLWRDESSGLTRGKYYYKHIGKDIQLEGQRGTALELNEITEPFDNAGKRPVSATWRGKFSGDTVTGEWRDVKRNKSYTFELKKTADTFVSDPESGFVLVHSGMRDIPKDSNEKIVTQINEKTMPYDFYRLNQPFKQNKEISVNDSIAYRQLTDPLSKVSFFRLTRHPDTHAMARINSFLQHYHWSRILDAYECRLLLSRNGLGESGGYEDIGTTVEFATKDILSWSEGGSIFCGGAHPNNFYIFYTLDMHSGKPFDFDKVLDLATVQKRKQFIGFIKTQYQKQIQGLSKDDAELSAFFVEYLEEGLQNSDQALPRGKSQTENLIPGTSFVFTKTGLSIVLTSVPHVASAALGEKVELSHAQLKRFMKSGAERYWQ